MTVALAWIVFIGLMIFLVFGLFYILKDWGCLFFTLFLLVAVLASVALCWSIPIVADSLDLLLE